MGGMVIVGGRYEYDTLLLLQCCKDLAIFKNTFKSFVVLAISVTVIKFYFRFFLIIFGEISCHVLLNVLVALTIGITVTFKIFNF